MTTALQGQGTARLSALALESTSHWFSLALPASYGRLTGIDTDIQIDGVRPSVLYRGFIRKGARVLGYNIIVVPQQY
jgi:hypothetical protein